MGGMGFWEVFASGQMNKPLRLFTEIVSGRVAAGRNFAS